MDDNRKKALAAALGQIEKQFGKGSVMRLGDAAASYDVEAVSTGSLGLDIALGIGGLPRGRVIEIYGPESSGKTTLTLQVVAEIQKLGGTAAFVDAEHALDPSYAEKLGVNVNELLVSQPDTGEQALEITDMLVRSNAVDLVVIDSVAALTPKAEIEGEMGEPQMGLHARLMSQALRKLTGNISRSNTMVIFINQIRMKIGVMFGNPETTTGGNALKFYASVRLDIRRIGAIKNGEEVVGNQTRVKVVKNKVAPPFREAEFEIMYGLGISREGEIIDMGSTQGIIEKSGAWYSYNGERIGQGKDNARDFLKARPELAKEIENQIRAKLVPVKPARPELKSVGVGLRGLTGTDLDGRLSGKDRSVPFSMPTMRRPGGKKHSSRRRPPTPSSAHAFAIACWRGATSPPRSCAASSRIAASLEAPSSPSLTELEDPQCPQRRSLRRKRRGLPRPARSGSGPHPRKSCARSGLAAESSRPPWTRPATTARTS